MVMICFFIARSLPAARLKSTFWSEASLADAPAIVTAERLPPHLPDRPRRIRQPPPRRLIAHTHRSQLAAGEQRPQSRYGASSKGHHVCHFDPPHASLPVVGARNRSPGREPGKTGCRRGCRRSGELRANTGGTPHEATSATIRGCNAVTAGVLCRPRGLGTKARRYS